MCSFVYHFIHQPRGAASRRAQALYDCQADHHDELSFFEGQVLVVLGQEDSDWWVRVNIVYSDWCCSWWDRGALTMKSRFRSRKRVCTMCKGHPASSSLTSGTAHFETLILEEWKDISAQFCTNSCVFVRVCSARLHRGRTGPERLVPVLLRPAALWLT